MDKEHSVKTISLFTIITAALLASTSLVYAIDPNASTALQSAKQQSAVNARSMQERITLMEDRIRRMDEELLALREQKCKTNESCTPKS